MRKIRLSKKLPLFNRAFKRQPVTVGILEIKDIHVVANEGFAYLNAAFFELFMRRLGIFADEIQRKPGAMIRGRFTLSLLQHQCAIAVLNPAPPQYVVLHPLVLQFKP